MKELEYEADLLPAIARQTGPVELVDPAPVDLDRAVVDRVDAPDQVQECRLARSGAAQDGDDLTRLEVEVGTVEQQPGRAALADALLDPACSEQRHRRSVGSRAHRLGRYSAGVVDVALRTRLAHQPVAQDDRDPVADRIARLAEVLPPVLDRDHVVAVDRGVAVALAVAAALLGDREVEPDLAGLRPGDVGRVLLADRHAAAVGLDGEQLRVGERVLLAERDLVLERRAVEARPGVEVVELDRVEPLVGAADDHLADPVGGTLTLLRGADVDQVLPTPVRIVPELAEDEALRPVGPLVGPIGPALVRLGLEGVDVTDGIGGIGRRADR